jgi:hypothetical protein
MINLSARLILTRLVIGIAALTIYAGTILGQTANGAGSSSATEEQSIVPTGVNPWASFKGYDTGYDTSVTMHASGLIVEVHSSPQSPFNPRDLWYHIGKLNPASGVSWGPSHRFAVGTQDTHFNEPSVAITKEGYVVIVYSMGSAKEFGRLRYDVGTLNPDGGTDQEIDFKIKDEYYDTGWLGHVAVNNNGVIAEVHEGDGSNGIFYRLGHLNSPGTGDFSIVWDTGPGGKKYDNGGEPRISLNDNGDVVEVHIAGPKDYKIHYSRGKLSGNTIKFADEHPRLDDNGFGPVVALLNNGYVMTFRVHVNTGPFHDPYYELTYRVGTLDKNNSTFINWIEQNTFPDIHWLSCGVATNGAYAVATAGQSGGGLEYSWAIAP